MRVWKYVAAVAAVTMASGEMISSVEDVLAKYVPEAEREQVLRVLHGKGSEAVQVTPEVQQMADKGNFQVRIESLVKNSLEEVRRPRRVVRVGAIQNAIPMQPTNGTIEEQYQALVKRLDVLIDAAGRMGVNVLGLQETWTSPFFFATREKFPYVELAEDARTGPSATYIARKAKQWGMVIVSPILERDVEHNERIWNTAVIFGHTGNYIGKHRKNHIPRVGDFNEATYYSEGDTGHPVFETVFGRIAVNICFGRHHHLNWMAFGMQGAEIVFNPSATVGALSEPLWGIEARAAAIFNSYFTVGINRVGTEHYPNAFTSGNGGPAHTDFGHFYGSSYVAAPDGSRTPPLTRLGDGVLATDLDLNQIRQVRDFWMFPITARYELYAKRLADFVKPNFKPQIIRDPALTGNPEPSQVQSEPHAVLPEL